MAKDLSEWTLSNRVMPDTEAQVFHRLAKELQVSVTEMEAWILQICITQEVVQMQIREQLPKDPSLAPDSKILLQIMLKKDARIQIKRIHI